MTPKWPVPKLLSQAIGERLGRPVTLGEIGMGEAETIDADAGLDFPRDPADAVRVPTSFWSSVNRRDFLAGSGFAVSAFTTPVTRWLVNPTDGVADHRGGGQVGRADLDELREAADDARRWDSKYGGGNWKANSVTDCLDHRAGPLLRGSFSDVIGRELFSVTAELSRLAGWTAFGVGQHDAAQRHFIQALRLARAGGDAQLGCYVLTTMAMQALMRGFGSEAVDMAQGAFNRAKGQAVPRVLAFTKLIEARAHARENDPRAASKALKTSEDLMDQAKDDSGDEPAWIDFYHHARLSADAAEIFRDLKNPRLPWPGISRPPPCRPARSPVPSVCGSPSSGPPTCRPVTSTTASSSATAASTSSPASSRAGRRTTSASSMPPSLPGGVSQPSASSSTAPAKNSASARDCVHSLGGAGPARYGGIGTTCRSLGEWRTRVSVEESWEKIERWLDQYAPQEQPLPGPCTRSELDGLYSALGVRLPEDVEQALLRHNGSGLTDVIPATFALYGAKQIADEHLGTLKYKLKNDHYGWGDSRLIVPIGALGEMQLVVDTQTGRLGSWDIEETDYRWFEGPGWASLSAALEVTGNALASPPPWIAVMGDGDEWRAIDMDTDFPGTLVWADVRG
jgi:hypothetical protein